MTTEVEIPLAIDLNQPAIHQFFAKIDVHPVRDGLDEDATAACLVRAILDPSPTIASRALLAVRVIIAGAGQMALRLVDAADRLAGILINPPTPNTLFNMLLARCEDERVNSRKAAILAVETFCLNRVEQIDGGALILNLTVEMLQLRCRDHSLTIRKQAAESLTHLLHRFSAIAANDDGAMDVGRIQDAWLHAVMTQIVDREMPVQQHAAKLVVEMLITPLVENRRPVDENNAWALLRVVECRTELRRLLLRVLAFMHTEKILPLNFAQILNRAVGHAQNAKAAWMLLAELSAFSKMDPGVAADQWMRMLTDAGDPFSDSANRIVQYVAKVLANGAAYLANARRNSLTRSMSDLLIDFRLSTSHISTICYAFAKVCDGLGKDASNTFILEQFNGRWFTACVKAIDTIIYEADVAQPFANDCESIQEERMLAATIPASIGGTLSEAEIQQTCDKLERIIFSIGECLQYSPKFLNKDIFKTLKLLIASDKLKAIAQSAGTTPRPRTPADELAPASTQQSQYTGISSTYPTFSSESGRQSEMVLKVYGRQVRQEFLTRRVRAQSVLTLGKLCLLDEQLAKKCVPVFVKQLEINPDHIVRNNIVVVVCDLCIRYTLLVDKYSAILASCLNDTSVLVRQQTLMLLTNLIKEQFLKWEGAIIFRFMIALLDAHDMVRQYAGFCLNDILLPQFPMMFFNYFLECLFHFNQVKHQTWNITDEENAIIPHQSQANEAFSLVGVDKARERMVLYKFMMKTFSDDQKYKICERIASEVFANVRDAQAGDDTMRFDDPNVVNLLLDSFRIMKSSDMKLSLQVGQRHVDDQADEDDPSEDHKKVAKKLIAKVFGDKIVGATIPHLLQLREFLIEKRSPLAEDCFAVIIEFHKDYQQNFEEIFASDPMIKAEIDFYLKQQRRNAANRNDNNPNDDQ